jgi:choline-sulfatase
MKLWSFSFGVCALACQAPSASSTKPATELAASSAVAAPSVAAPAAVSSQAQSAAPAARVPGNVLLLTVDSLRSDMPWTGYPRSIAPNLEALSKASTMYPRAYSISSYTAKSLPGLLAGRYPSSLYRSGWFFASFPDANLFFPELLQKQGSRTMALHAHLYFDRGKGINQGFDEWQLVEGLTFNATTDKAVTSDKLTDKAIALLSNPENTKQPFFLWSHYMDPHDEYKKHSESPDFGKTNRDRYDSEVFFTDLHIGRLLDFARKQAWFQNTSIIITADHGEAFGEHGMYKHAFELWDVLTHVPLIIFTPGATPRIIDERRSAIDLAPTILELMGAKLPADLMGKSLVPELHGEKPENREPIFLDLPEDRNCGDRHAILAGDYKLIVQNFGAIKLLFNLKTDPGELTDLRKREPAKFTEMLALYDKTVQGMPIIEPFGGMKLASGKTARGPEGPAAAAGVATSPAASAKKQP